MANASRRVLLLIASDKKRSILETLFSNISLFLHLCHSLFGLQRDYHCKKYDTLERGREYFNVLAPHAYSKA